MTSMVTTDKPFSIVKILFSLFNYYLKKKMCVCVRAYVRTYVSVSE